MPWRAFTRLGVRVTESLHSTLKILVPNYLKSHRTPPKASFKAFGHKINNFNIKKHLKTFESTSSSKSFSTWTIFSKTSFKFQNHQDQHLSNNFSQNQASFILEFKEKGLETWPIIQMSIFGHQSSIGSIPTKIKGGEEMCGFLPQIEGSSGVEGVGEPTGKTWWSKVKWEWHGWMKKKRKWGEEVCVVQEKEMKRLGF